MRPLFVFTLLVLIGTGVFAGENGDGRLTCYAETISLEPDGGADIVVRLCASGLRSDTEVMLPYAYASLPDSFVPGASIHEVATRTLFGRRQVYVTVSDEVLPTDTLEFRFHLSKASSFGTESAEDFGNRAISYRIVQSSPVPVALMSVRMVLPEGVVVNKIVSSTPAGKSNSSSSPYMLGMCKGRHCVTLTDSTVNQGDVLALEFQAKPGKKSPAIIIALVLAAGAYLFAFRGLLKRTNNGAAR
jgi:hypothetical protein